MSWRVNFINFWVAAGTAVFNTLIGAFVEWANLGWVIQQAIAAALVGVGIYFGWFMKNLWYNYDPEGTLAKSDLNWASYTFEHLINVTF